MGGMKVEQARELIRVRRVCGCTHAPMASNSVAAAAKAGRAAALARAYQYSLANANRSAHFASFRNLAGRTIQNALHGRGPACSARGPWPCARCADTTCGTDLLESLQWGDRLIAFNPTPAVTATLRPVRWVDAI